MLGGFLVTKININLTINSFWVIVMYCPIQKRGRHKMDKKIEKKYIPQEIGEFEDEVFFCFVCGRKIEGGVRIRVSSPRGFSISYYLCRKHTPIEF